MVSKYQKYDEEMLNESDITSAKHCIGSPRSKCIKLKKTPSIKDRLLSKVRGSNPRSASAQNIHTAPDTAYARYLQLPYAICPGLT